MSEKNYNVRMTKEGYVIHCEIDDTFPHFTKPHFICYRQSDCIIAHLCMDVCAKDPKHAIKIVNEKRVQLIANNQWGTI